MLIEVNKLYQCEEDEGILIKFSSQYGYAKGLWQGNMPKIHQSYYVELDVPKTLHWGTDIILSECMEYKIWYVKDIVYLNAKLESYEDCCLTVRLGDSLVLIATNGIPYSDHIFLKIQISEILLYPIFPFAIVRKNHV